jgi:hypothetical protein
MKKTAHAVSLVVGADILSATISTKYLTSHGIPWIHPAETLSMLHKDIYESDLS